LEYYPVGEFDFSTRSPHNVFVTTFGRMGLAGCAILLCIYLAHAERTRALARSTRGDAAQTNSIRWTAATWIVLVSSCFGVVLEGPMGAIPFWILLGLAHEQASKDLSRSNEPNAT
jgi:hypothetical protein